MSTRREFITLIGAAAAWPVAARAQQPDRMRRIGMLVGLPEGDPEGEKWVQAFLRGMSQLGWRLGTNFQLDVRWVATDFDRTQAIAKELVQSRPDLIQVTSTPATTAIMRETQTIPVVFASVSDPIGAGFIQTLTRPGGNATGFVNIEASLGGKWVEVLKEVAPGISRAAMMFNPKTSPQTGYYRQSLEAAASSLRVDILPSPVGNSDEIQKVMVGLGQHSDAGLIVVPDVFTAAQAQRDLITSLAVHHRIPVVYFIALFVRAGGLISYGVDHPDLQRRAATYTDRILKGAKPQDLPVQLPTKFELVINLKTAKAMDLTVPPTLIARADEVIE
jgi:putative tryptophan/tyrosine transport system substrate-binding protein